MINKDKSIFDRIDETNQKLDDINQKFDELKINKENIDEANKILEKQKNIEINRLIVLSNNKYYVRPFGEKESMNDQKILMCAFALIISLGILNHIFAFLAYKFYISNLFTEEIFIIVAFIYSYRIVNLRNKMPNASFKSPLKQRFDGAFYVQKTSYLFRYQLLFIFSYIFEITSVLSVFFIEGNLGFKILESITSLILIVAISVIFIFWRSVYLYFFAVYTSISYKGEKHYFLYDYLRNEPLKYEAFKDNLNL